MDGMRAKARRCSRSKSGAAEAFFAGGAAGVLLAGLAALLGTAAATADTAVEGRDCFGREEERPAVGFAATVVVGRCCDAGSDERDERREGAALDSAAGWPLSAALSAASGVGVVSSLNLDAV